MHSRRHWRGPCPANIRANSCRQLCRRPVRLRRGLHVSHLYLQLTGPSQWARCTARPTRTNCASTAPVPAQAGCWVIKRGAHACLHSLLDRKFYVLPHGLRVWVTRREALRHEAVRVSEGLAAALGLLLVPEVDLLALGHRHAAGARAQDKRVADDIVPELQGGQRPPRRHLVRVVGLPRRRAGWWAGGRGASG